MRTAKAAFAGASLSLVAWVCAAGCSNKTTPNPGVDGFGQGTSSSGGGTGTGSGGGATSGSSGGSSSGASASSPSADYADGGISCGAQAGCPQSEQCCYGAPVSRRGGRTRVPADSARIRGAAALTCTSAGSCRALRSLARVRHIVLWRQVCCFAYQASEAGAGAGGPGAGFGGFGAPMAFTSACADECPAQRHGPLPALRFLERLPERRVVHPRHLHDVLRRHGSASRRPHESCGPDESPELRRRRLGLTLVSDQGERHDRSRDRPDRRRRRRRATQPSREAECSGPRDVSHPDRSRKAVSVGSEPVRAVVAQRGGPRLLGGPRLQELFRRGRRRPPRPGRGQPRQPGAARRIRLARSPRARHRRRARRCLRRRAPNRSRRRHPLRGARRAALNHGDQGGASSPT